MQRIQGVVQPPRVTRRSDLFFVQLTPVGAQEDSLLELGNRQVEVKPQVEEVAPDPSVDEVLREREVSRVFKGRVDIGSDTSDRTDRRFQVFQISHQVGLSVVDQPGGGVAEHAQLVQGGRQARPLFIQHLQRGRYLAQCLGEDVTLVGEGGGKPVQRLDGRDDVLALLVERADELVQPNEQVANSACTPGQGGIEVVDNLPDFP